MLRSSFIPLRVAERKQAQLADSRRARKEETNGDSRKEGVVDVGLIQILDEVPTLSRKTRDSAFLSAIRCELEEEEQKERGRETHRRERQQHSVELEKKLPFSSSRI